MPVTLILPIEKVAWNVCVAKQSSIAFAEFNLTGGEKAAVRD